MLRNETQGIPPKLREIPQNTGNSPKTQEISPEIYFYPNHNNHDHTQTQSGTLNNPGVYAATKISTV